MVYTLHQTTTGIDRHASMWRMAKPASDGGGDVAVASRRRGFSPTYLPPPPAPHRLPSHLLPTCLRPTLPACHTTHCHILHCCHVIALSTPPRATFHITNYFYPQALPHHPTSFSTVPWHGSRACHTTASHCIHHGHPFIHVPVSLYSDHRRSLYLPYHQHTCLRHLFLLATFRLPARLGIYLVTPADATLTRRLWRVGNSSSELKKRQPHRQPLHTFLTGMGDSSILSHNIMLAAFDQP